MYILPYRFFFAHFFSAIGLKSSLQTFKIIFGNHKFQKYAMPSMIPEAQADPAK